VLSSRLDYLLTRFSAWQHRPPADGPLPTHRIDTPAGRLRVFDSGSSNPCVVLSPDGPNVIEHYETLIRLLAPTWRVVCFDFPGFGHSLPSPRYTHSLDDGAGAVLAVLAALDIRQARR
jgi:pimeloyl-ACP methyl ester carboxylesterase